MSEEPHTDDVFADLDTDAEDILGTHTYEDVLYTGETDIVNVMTGETPERLDRSVEEAKEFAANAGVTDTPKVAKAQHREQAVEGGSPYSACAFFHFSITGSLDRHKAYKAAFDSDDYTVTHDTDYETGNLTITVEQS